MNRLLQFICDPKTCPSASNCTNTSLGRRNNVKTTVAYYGRRGFGLKTLEAIGKDDFIDEYRGEVISYNEMVRRSAIRTMDNTVVTRQAARALDFTQAVWIPVYIKGRAYR